MTRGNTNEFQSKLACVMEASESTKLRVEKSLPNYHEDHIARRGDNSLQHYNLVHNFSYASSHEDGMRFFVVQKSFGDTKCFFWETKKCS